LKGESFDRERIIVKMEREKWTLFGAFEIVEK